MKFPPVTKTFRSYANYESEKFCAELKRVNWEEDVDAPGNKSDNLCYVDQLWLSFRKLFLAVADKHAPLISKKNSGH